MTTRYGLLLLASTLLAVAAGADRAAADPLWRKLMPSARVEADPHKDYTITRDNGPWLIVATTFSGEGAESQARELVLELRKRYKLDAYIHEMSFDFTQGVQGKGVDRTGQPLRMRYQRNKKFRELAVLIGDFPYVDDTRAQKALRQIKHMTPETLDVEKRKQTNQALALFRRVSKSFLPQGDERRKRGPMGKAFITLNPLLPQQPNASPGVDKLVVEMNKGVKYSLLECKGKYTVQVATFGGMVVLDQHKIEELGRGKPLKSKLAEAADKAHRLTLALRQKGYEAYEFHDRGASLVTIGSFQTVGSPRPDGRIEIDRRIHTIIKEFSAVPRSSAEALPVSTHAQTAFKVKMMPSIGLPFDIQPQVIHVPRRSISSDYVR